ncbi:MAG TPA: hypothetical protein ENI87_08880 [bacterium]|nr:hypothetical protein [bacterium]
MNHSTLSLLSAVAIGGALFAQNPSFVLTFSQPENTLSGSGGTVLGTLRPNEIDTVSFFGPCTTLSAEKWMPRTCAHTMAGDADGDGIYFQNSIFGSIDALLSTSALAGIVPLDTQRSIYWSPSVAMGTAVSGVPGLRPGDVGRINRVGGSEGQVVHFITQEQVNNALGLPPSYAIDVDAIAFQPNYGVFFSIDVDVPAMTVCGPTLVRDGDVLCLPPASLGYTTDLRIASTTPNSAVVAYSEAQMNAFTANAQVTDRFGVCLTAVGDVEALEIDLFGPTVTVVPCPGVVVLVPNLIFASENGTGGSLLETASGGVIHNNLCGPVGTPCGFGPTFGPQIGIRPASTTTGAASHVNALAGTRVCTHVLEPQSHVMTSPAPAGANMVAYNNPFVLSLILIQLPPSTSLPVPMSIPVPPWSQNCFPDLYAPSIFPWMPVGPGFGTFPTPAIPAGWTGKILFQGVGFASASFELSTPTVIDVL